LKAPEACREGSHGQARSARPLDRVKEKKGAPEVREEFIARLQRASHNLR
jgi:hypothetical protein